MVVSVLWRIVGRAAMRRVWSRRRGEREDQVAGDGAVVAPCDRRRWGTARARGRGSHAEQHGSAAEKPRPPSAAPAGGAGVHWSWLIRSGYERAAGGERVPSR